VPAIVTSSSIPRLTCAGCCARATSWPRRRAAEKRDKFAPPDAEHGFLPGQTIVLTCRGRGQPPLLCLTQRIPHRGPAVGCCIAEFCLSEPPGLDRLWVKSRIPPERSHVSFRQLLRTYQRTRVQQLCATRRPEQVQQRPTCWAAIQSAFVPCTLQFVGMLPRPAVEPICNPFINQIAVLPLVSRQRMSLFPSPL
jgi:hypothetical protein